MEEELIHFNNFLFMSIVKSFDQRKIFKETVGRINFLQNLFHRLLWNKWNGEHYCPAIWFSSLLFRFLSPIYIFLCFVLWKGFIYAMAKRPVTFTNNVLLTSDVWIVKLTLESPGGYELVPLNLLFQQSSNHLAILLESSQVL